MRLARVFAPIAIAGLVMAGCAVQKGPVTPAAPPDNGVKALTASEILTKATAALNEAGSFHVKGDMTEEGTKLSIDLKLKGKDAAGTIGTPDGTIKILRIGADAYFQADAAFWKKFGGDMGDNIAVLFKDKWVKVPATSKDFAEFTDMADPAAILKPSGTPTKGDEKVVNGTPTIGINDGDQGTMFIATTGKPYPIRMEAPNNGGAIDFTEFGVAFDDIKAPPATDVVDLSAILPK